MILTLTFLSLWMFSQFHLMMNNKQIPSSVLLLLPSVIVEVHVLPSVLLSPLFALPTHTALNVMCSVKRVPGNSTCNYLGEVVCEGNFREPDCIECAANFEGPNCEDCMYISLQDFSTIYPVFSFTTVVGFVGSLLFFVLIGVGSALLVVCVAGLCLIQCCVRRRRAKH